MSKYLATSVRLCLMVCIVGWLLMPSYKELDGWCSSLSSLERDKNNWLLTGLSTWFCIVPSGTDQSSLVSYFSPLEKLSVFVQDLDLDFVKLWWLETITLINTLNTTEKLLSGVMFSAVLWYPRILVIVLMLVWKLLFPVRFLVVASSLLCLRILVWPFEVIADVILETCAWFTKKYHKLMDVIEDLRMIPQRVMEWCSGNTAKMVVPTVASCVSESIESKLDRILMALGRKGTVLEAAQPGSDFVECEQWPNGLVAIRRHDGRIVGMGFLVVLNGKWRLVTAAHVARECKRGIMLSAGIDSKTVTFQDLDVVLQTQVDACIMNVPAGTAASLGVRKVVINRTPSESKVVRAYGYNSGKFCMSEGLVGTTSANMGFRHGCSTLRGWSGTPIYRDNKVVGIHSRCNGIYENFGLSLDLLVGRLESEESDRYARTMEEFNAEDRPVTPPMEFSWEFEEKFERVRSTRKSFARIESEVATFTATKLSGFDWTDDAPMDFDELPVFESTMVSVFQERPLGGPPISNGNKVEEKKITSEALEPSKSSTPEAAKHTRRRRRNKKKSKNSETGHGPEEQSQQQSRPSSPIPDDSAPVSSPPVSTPSTGSVPKSWTQAYTQKLVLLLGSMDGQSKEKVDLAVLEAKSFASALFPPSKPKSSEESEK
uniref:Serine protease n=1 Tax=Mushroom bacilliform virus TaxID=32625 RepID=A0A1Q1M982_9VIRU|nr:serine protease [Mushroom bacilliform virus]